MWHTYLVGGGQVAAVPCEGGSQAILVPAAEVEVLGHLLWRVEKETCHELTIATTHPFL